MGGRCNSHKAASLRGKLRPSELHLISETLETALQASDVLYSGVISGFRWTEEPRCIWPLSVQNSIKAKPDLLRLSLPFPPSLFLLISLQFTVLYWHEWQMSCIAAASNNKHLSFVGHLYLCIPYMLIYWWNQQPEPFAASLSPFPYLLLSGDITLDKLSPFGLNLNQVTLLLSEEFVCLKHIFSLPLSCRWCWSYLPHISGATSQNK